MPSPEVLGLSCCVAIGLCLAIRDNVGALAVPPYQQALLQPELLSYSFGRRYGDTIHYTITPRPAARL